MDANSSCITSVLERAAKEYGAPPLLLKAMCWVESRFGKNIINYEDPSYGVCQVMAPIARNLGWKKKEGDLIRDHISAKYAALLLSQLIKQHKGNWAKAAAAYNAGKNWKYNWKYVNKVMKALGGRPWQMFELRGCETGKSSKKKYSNIVDNTL